MLVLDKFERKYGKYAVSHLTPGLIVPQVILYVLSITQPEILQAALLIPRLVMQGQVWRLVTFLFVPPVTNPIFAFFFWYLFFLMGTALEQHWGEFRYNVYLLIGYLATIAASFLTPDVPSSNAFLQGSVFLAFAFLYPDFQLYLFFILPVKIKWLAALTWIGYFLVLVFGSWTARFLMLASVSNFLLFFGEDIRDRIRTGKRHMAFQARQLGVRPKNEPFHRCAVCGITDQTHPDMDFRYCTECDPVSCYCTEHLSTHRHRIKPPEAAQKE